MKYQISLSPPSVPQNDNSFTYYPPQGLVSSSNNSMMNVSQEATSIMSIGEFSGSDVLSRKNAKDPLSVASAGATWSATASSINGDQ